MSELKYNEIPDLLKATATRVKEIEPESPMWAGDLAKAALLVKRSQTQQSKLEDILKAIKEDLEYEVLDAWQERPDGLFEYRGTGEYGVQQALAKLNALIGKGE